MIYDHKNELYLFHQGTYFKAYEFFGAHKTMDENGAKGTVFRTWAPNADAVFVTGDFNGWRADMRMNRISDRGVWELYTALDFDNRDRTRYKYMLVNGGRVVFKADPYAVFDGMHKETASYLYELPDFHWEDGAWMSARGNAMYAAEDKPPYSTPINIYEVHLGSVKRHDDNTYCGYRELADFLVPYVKDMGYTHIELLPVAEHPLDDSWGYQICGFYAPTSRYGTPEDFMYFVNEFHKAGIGVILDWVPAHFSKDAHGLADFDGGMCYEYQGDDRKEHKVWGTRFFDVGREEVQSFLISNALYWLNEYHVDGLRVDAVAAMLYLDFDRAPGEWTPAPDGSNRNYEAIAFFKKLNTEIFRQHGDALMIAEESSDWPMLTKPVYMGGLGFNFKWNMGWMNDMIKYVNTDPLFRRYEHGCITFSLMYAFSENYILSISHDEVVHGKGSLINKMFGTYDQKFDGLRCFLAYMMCHPGKKLLFMGSEYGQFAEWDNNKQLEWFMLDFEKHRDLLNYTKALNHFYLSSPQLWERDLSWDGFKWIKADDKDSNTAVFTRTSGKGEFLVCAFNFSAVSHENYRFGVPEPGVYKEVFSSYPEDRPEIESENIPCDGFENSISVDLYPLSAVIFGYEPAKKPRPKTRRKPKEK